MPLIRPTNLLLTFDAFGTLFTPKFPIAAQYAFVGQQHGLVGMNEDKVRVAFKKGNYILSAQFICSIQLAAHCEESGFLRWPMEEKRQSHD